MKGQISDTVILRYLLIRTSVQKVSSPENPRKSSSTTGVDALTELDSVLEI